MKAMLWKEFRENIKWALLAMIGLGLAEFYGMTKRDQYYLSPDDAGTLCKSSFLMATTFGCAVVGLVLGLVQILPEQRRDQWAALIHRPVERAVIFRGKAIAGFLLYLLATVPPFLACVWYVATPGHFASPFVPKMVYPGVADICAGSMYYFGALFVALRRGPWYGVRVLGLLAAVYTSAFITSIYQPFQVSVEAAVLMALALFTASWSVMLTNGSFRGQPWPGRFAVLAVAFYGVAGLSHLGLALQQSLVRLDFYFGTQYIVDLTGRVLKEVETKDQAPKFYDLAGNEITDKQFTRNTYSHTLAFSGLSSHIGSPHGVNQFRSVQQYRQARTYLAQSSESPGEVWFYVIPSRIFVGYKAQSYARIGSIGADGFQAAYQPAAPLPGPYKGADYQVPNFGLVDNTVYHLDLDQRQLTLIFSEPGTTVFGCGGMQSYQQNVDLTDIAAVALLHEARIIDKTGLLVATLPYHQDVDRDGMIQVAVMPDRAHFFLRYEPSDWIDWRERETMPSYLEEMDAKGTVLASYTFPPEPIRRGHESWQQIVEERLQSPVYTYGEIVYARIGAALGVKHLQRQVTNIFAADMHGYRVFLFQMTLTSLVFAIITLFWARSAWFSWRHAWLWALFVFGFNLAGLIVFRLCADWPVRVKCPSCGHKRPVDFEKCPACGAGWPEPAREGIEIFTPVESAPAAGAVPSA
jgi:hypothetical protein